MIPANPQNHASQTDNASDADNGETDTIAAGLNARNASSQAKPAKPRDSVGGGAADDTLAGGTGGDKPQPTPEEELKQLRERVAKMEGEKNGRDAARKAEDFRDQFINETAHPDYPRELLRKMLPATTDKNALHAAGNSLNGMIKQIINAHVKSGHLKYVNIGGASRDGGSAADFAVKSDSPVDQIADGLNNRGGSQSRSKIDGGSTQG